jgi:hypothetical protein
VAPAPAADSLSPDAAPGPASPASVLGTAKAADATEEPTAPEAAATEAEAPPPETPPPEAPPEPVTLPAYEPFTAPEGVTLDPEQVGRFTGLLGEYEQKLAADPTAAHAATQELGQKIVDLYIAEQQESAQRHARLMAENWTRTREAWVSEFREDPDIGGARQDQTVAKAGAMLELYGQRVGPEREAALRSVMDLTGAGDNPEVLRFMNWAADFAIERPRMIAARGPTGPQPVGRAARLYRNSIPTNGAA